VSVPEDVTIGIFCQNHHSGFNVAAIHLADRFLNFSCTDSIFASQDFTLGAIVLEDGALPSEGITIERFRCEQGVDGVYFIDLLDTTSQGFRNMDIQHGTISGGNAGWRGIRYRRVRGGV